MSKEEMLAIFTLAGIKVLVYDELANGYWPRHPNYDAIRAASPWWLVNTELGAIRLGWRKRVIEIDWERTGLACLVTKDAVTMEPTMVHAYGYAKAVEYLIALRLIWERKQNTEQVQAAINAGHNKESHA